VTSGVEAKLAAVRECLAGLFADATGLGFRWKGDDSAVNCYPFGEGRIGSLKNVGIDATRYTLEGAEGSQVMRRRTVGRRSFVFSVRILSEAAGGTGASAAKLDRFRLYLESDAAYDRMIAADLGIAASGTVTELDPPPGFKLSQAILDVTFETVVEECEEKTYPIDQVDLSSDITHVDGATSSAQIVGVIPDGN